MIVTQNELAEILKLTVKTLIKLRKKGMPCMKAGKAVRYDLEEVKAWMQGQDAKTENEK